MHVAKLPNILPATVLSNGHNKEWWLRPRAAGVLESQQEVETMYKSNN